MKVIDFGCKNYEEILLLQRELFQKIIQEKKVNGRAGEEYLLIGEHFPVITLGRRADKRNVLIRPEKLEEKGLKIYEIERGGDTTYHCPGQLIAYPILDLSLHKLGVKKYVDLLEESVIILLNRHGIRAKRIPGATGVWIKEGDGEERKICAIGVKCSHFCTMHGLALNVNADLSGFDMINPCGFKDRGVTSIAKELKEIQDFEEIKKEFSDIFLSLIFSFEEILDLSE